MARPAGRSDRNRPHRRVRRMILSSVLTVSVLLTDASSAASCWLPPVAGVVTDPFREPLCRWCAGNRGLEYRVDSSTRVRAVAPGVVVYAGEVAGVGYVVVRHGDGRRATYGRLVERAVARGDQVVSGARLGTASGTFYFGLRNGDRYVDPAPHLGRLVGRPRLIPTDGSAARPAPTPRVRCGSGTRPR